MFCLRICAYTLYNTVALRSIIYRGVHTAHRNLIYVYTYFALRIPPKSHSKRRPVRIFYIQMYILDYGDVV